MKSRLRSVFGAIVIVLVTMPTAADQTPQLQRVMRQKLTHSQAILGAVVTSDWATLDRESRALAKAAQDPAWIVMTAPEYLRYSDAFMNALHRLILASASKDLDAAAGAQIELTTSCVRCHQYLTRRRIVNVFGLTTQSASPTRTSKSASSGRTLGSRALSMLP